MNTLSSGHLFLKNIWSQALFSLFERAYTLFVPKTTLLAKPSCREAFKKSYFFAHFGLTTPFKHHTARCHQEARAYYEQHRSWRGSSRKRAKLVVVAPPASPGVVKLGRDEQRVRQRYLRMSKEALIERLITAERTLAAQRERWLSQQDEVLTWRLRAEAAEARLKRE